MRGNCCIGEIFIDRIIGGGGGGGGGGGEGDYGGRGGELLGGEGGDGVAEVVVVERGAEKNRSDDV